MLELIYKNERGEIIMHGDRNSPLHITEIEGLSLPTRDYNTVTYSGYGGQTTTAYTTRSRTITFSVEATGKDILSVVRKVIDVFSVKGMLYIKTQDVDRRIECNQAQIADVNRILKGQISTMVIQLVCDSPFFEDAEDTVIPLYTRKKLIYSDSNTRFELPAKFGEITVGEKIRIQGSIPVEPIITMYYPEQLEGVESIIITNVTSGQSIRLNYQPQDDDLVTIDIRNRKITSSQSGNLINNLSEDTFLGDFVFDTGVNAISVVAGDVTSGFTIQCKYNNLYNEAVIV